VILCLILLITAKLLLHFAKQQVWAKGLYQSQPTILALPVAFRRMGSGATNSIHSLNRFFESTGTGVVID